MKLTYTICILLLFISSFSYSQWRPLNTFPKSISLNSVYFTDDDHGWIAGSEGTILKFNPLLYNWNQITTKNSEDLNSIAFFDITQGIAVGMNGTLLSSSDGGNNWDVNNSGTTEHLNQVYILNNTTGWIVGNHGVLLTTTNSGKKWSTVKINTSKALTSVYFTSVSKGVVGTDSSSIYITTNGGSSWVEKVFVSDPIWPWTIASISFTDPQNGYIGGGNHPQQEGFCMKTTDGGVTWNPGPHTYGSIRSLFFKDANNGVIVGGDNTWNKFLQIRKNSTDQYLIYHNEDFDIISCVISPSGKGWAVGGSGSVFYAQNYLEDWGQVLIGGQDHLSTISISNDKYFFLASSRPTFRTPCNIFQRSFHENRIWKDVSNYNLASGGGEIATHLCMIDSLYGYNLYDYGGIFRTTNGGFTWDIVSSPETFDGTPGGIYFLNKSTGWFFGDAIYKTTDNSATWSLQFTPSFQISDLRFTNNNTGYACGSDASLVGKVIKSTDGGNNWFPLSIPVTGHLTAVAFSNPDTGIVVGWGNTILKTFNGGASWNISTSGAKILTADRYSDKRIHAKNDSRYLLSSPKGSLYKETQVTTVGNYLDADFKGTAIFIASDLGLIISSTDYGNTFQQIDIGEAVLQIKFDAVQYAAARTATNIYLLKLDSPVPVELSAFKAINKNSSVMLEWVTATEVNSFIFEVERKSINDQWSKIYEVKAAGNSSTPQNYSYVDRKLNSGKYFYRLKSIDLDGTFKYSNEITATIDIPYTYSLSQNYPNPFNPSTKISYTLPYDSKVNLDIYSITGERIIQLVNEDQSAGYHTADFNYSLLNKNISSGVYFYRITVLEKAMGYNFISIKKMILLK